MAVQNTPYREIRAHLTPTTITVYQAYNSEIATAAVKNQRLDASPKFSATRMTWIKPSWAWMMYRSGYSYKDPGQERILAITLTHAAFLSLLQNATPSTSHGTMDAVGLNDDIKKSASVRVQWDPERTVRLEKLPYRSIQIGVPGALIGDLVEGTVKIEDVTNKARMLKRVLEDSKEIDMADLLTKELVPEEEVLMVNEQLRTTLEMDVEDQH
jgi:hypothetical protein